MIFLGQALGFSPLIANFSNVRREVLLRHNTDLPNKPLIAMKIMKIMKIVERAQWIVHADKFGAWVISFPAQFGHG